MPPAMLQQVEKYRIRRRRSILLLDRVPLQTSLRQILRSGKYLANIADKLPHIKYKAVWNHFCKCFNEMINERRIAAIITGGNMSTLLLDVVNFTPLLCKENGDLQFIPIFLPNLRAKILCIRVFRLI